MFARLVGFRAIVVTGPQRSGTTIAAQMIATDTGHTCFDETTFDVYDELAFRRLCCRDRVVIQAPALLKAICDAPPPDTLIVLMRRPLAEIHASEARIGWRDQWAPTELATFGLTDGDPAAVKYGYWDQHRPRLHLELDHGSLACHPMWVPAPARATFSAKQTACA